MFMLMLFWPPAAPPPAPCTHAGALRRASRHGSRRYHNTTPLGTAHIAGCQRPDPRRGPPRHKGCCRPGRRSCGQKPPARAPAGLRPPAPTAASPDAPGRRALLEAEAVPRLLKVPRRNLPRAQVAAPQAQPPAVVPGPLPVPHGCCCRPGCCCWRRPQPGCPPAVLAECFQQRSSRNQPAIGMWPAGRQGSSQLRSCEKTNRKAAQQMPAGCHAWS